MMLRSIFAYKPVLALASALALGSLLPATDAAAARYSNHDGFRAGGGFHNVGPILPLRRAAVRLPLGYHRPYAYCHFHRHGFREYPRYYHYYGYYDGCYRWRWFATPWGWRFSRLNMCYPYYGQYYHY